MIWQSIQAVVVIFLLLGAGILAAWRKWISPGAAAAFPKLLINLAVPCMVVYHFYTSIDRAEILLAWRALVVLAVAYPASYFLGKAFAVLFRVPITRRGVFSVLFSFSNSIFIGLPVAMALFGDPGLPFAMYYYLANTTFFWVLGYYAIRRDADAISGRRTRISVREILKKLAIPPIITLIVMFVVVLAGIPLPDFVVKTAGYLSDLTTPLSLLFMGSLIWDTGPHGLSFEKDIGIMFIGRFLLVPAVIFFASEAAMALFPASGASADLTLMRNVFTVQAGLPVMTQTVILAQMYDADVKFATKSFIWTTLASVITIPAYMVLFQYI
jgi:predicted permease